METVGTRELKQNPNGVIQHVLETGQAIAITSYGHPTGVRLVPDRPARPRRWVSGAALNQVTDTAPLSRTEAEAWQADIADAFGEDEITDPWDRA